MDQVVENLDVPWGKLCGIPLHNDRAIGEIFPRYKYLVIKP